MQRFPCLLLLLLLAETNLFGQANRAKLAITPLTDRHYVYTTYNRYGNLLFPSNSLYVLTKAGAVLIDTPWDTTQFQPLLDSIRIRHHQNVVLCIATHFHDDRTAGLAFLKRRGVKTYTSKLTDALSKVAGNAQAEFTFAGDTTFTVGEQTFETFYPGEGHSKDNLVVWFGKEKILYGGCLIKSAETDNLGNVTDANLTAWLPTINAVRQRYPDPAFVIPGHQGWIDKRGLPHTVRLLQQNRANGKN